MMTLASGNGRNTWRAAVGMGGAILLIVAGIALNKAIFDPSVLVVRLDRMERDLAAVNARLAADEAEQLRTAVSKIDVVEQLMAGQLKENERVAREFQELQKRLEGMKP